MNKLCFQIFPMYFLLTCCSDTVVRFERFSKFCISSLDNKVQVTGMLSDGFWAAGAMDSRENGGSLTLRIKQEKPNGFNSGSFKFEIEIGNDIKYIKYANEEILALNESKTACYNFGVLSSKKQ